MHTGDGDAIFITVPHVVRLVCVPVAYAPVHHTGALGGADRSTWAHIQRGQGMHEYIDMDRHTLRRQGLWLPFAMTVIAAHVFGLGYVA